MRLPYFVFAGVGLIKTWISKSVILRPLYNKNFAFFWAGQTISTLGNAIYNTALPLLIIKIGGSGKEISLANTFFVLPQILFLLVGGVVTDRFSKKLILFSSDFLCFLITAIITFLMFVNQSAFSNVYVMTFMLGAVFSFFIPSVNGFLSEIVDHTQLLHANSLRSISSQISRMVGPLICGLIFSTIGLVWAFGVNSISFLISFTFMLSISQSKQNKIAKNIHMFRGYLDDIIHGFRFMIQTQWLWITLVISAISSIFIAGFDVIVLPLLAYHQLGGSVGYSVIRSALAIGAVVGGFVLGRTKKVQARGKLYYAALCATGIGIFCFAFVRNVYFATVLGFLFGMGTTTFVIIWNTVLQELIPSDLLGRVSSINGLFSIILLPTGYLIIGYLSKSIGYQWIAAICGFVLVLLSAMGFSVKAIRELR